MNGTNTKKKSDKNTPMLLLPPPSTRATFRKTYIRLHARIIVGSVFIILGFSFSNTAFFNRNPLFGVQFLAEILISFACALFGFFIMPAIFVEIRDWAEKLISRIVAEIVSNFWAQQSKKIHEAQKIKQGKKAEIINKKAQEEEKKKNDAVANGILLDTSVLVDGRILDIIRSGFLDKVLIIPQAVIDELHLISDSSDTLKRQRGRRGLDIIKKLKLSTKIVFLDDKAKDAKVDKELVTLAKKYKVKLMTLDFNLNKVASVSGIKVLNINDLVNSVKTVALPGEVINVKIIQEGKEKGQGVGYLPDGTMLVVEGARGLVGNEVSAKVSRIIQGPAGKMIFCSLISGN